RRSYPRAMLAANVIGMVGVDGDGLAGIEHSFDRDIHGTPGKVTLLKDARKGMYLVGGEGANAPKDGHHVVLTIDSVIQFIAERALQSAVTKYRAAGGSVIVMDPNDGAILAMASAPTFDPNHFADFSPTAWRNRNLQDNYEPGSTFKIITATAGLEERVVTPSQILDCGNGEITVANVTIHEHDGHRYGLLSFEDVIVNSSNVGAGKTGTAQKAGRGGYSADRYVGSFAGYVPADRPRLAILVVIDEPRGEYYGGTVAAPAFREIAEATLRYLGVPPSLPSRSIGIAPPVLAAFSQHAPAGTAAGVPDLHGLDARAAIARAVASGLTVEATGSGVVTSQQP